MGTRAKSGACLVRLAKEAVPLLREAERRSPRTGPGAKPDIPDWLIGVLIMVAIIKRKKSKSAQFRFLKENRQLIATATGSGSCSRAWTGGCNTRSGNSPTCFWCRAT